MIKYDLDFPGSVKEHNETLKRSFGVRDIRSFKGSIIFGTGILGLKIAKIFKGLGVKVLGFADNDRAKWGKRIEGLPVISPAEIGGYKYTKLIIASKYVRDIASQLDKLSLRGIVPHFAISVLFPGTLPNPLHTGAMASILGEFSKIDRVYGTFTDAESKALFRKLLKFRITLSPGDLPAPISGQYYPGKFWKLSAQETYVDVGAFDGDTLQDFISRTGGKFDSYLALEPDKKNFLKLCESIPEKHILKVIPILAGAGAKTQNAYFSSFGRDDSSVSAAGSDKIRILALDALSSGRKFTTIKIDVEGYEPEVLTGSRRSIKNQRPKLAVCVYHRPDHLWRLPLQILKYNPKYSFYLRHHEPEIFGTVLYGIYQ